MNLPLKKQLLDIYSKFGISKELLSLSDSIMNSCKSRFEEIDAIREINQLKVLSAFQEVLLSESHFGGTTGYGYDDMGRDRLEEAFAKIFCAESALLRWQISSGTAAISLALFGLLRPGDKMLSVTGRPYDTLTHVIGIDESKGDGSLAEFNISYGQVDFTNDGEIDFEGIKASLTEDVKVVFIQKSKGYSQRKTLMNRQIGQIVKTVRDCGSKAYIVVDNCYGEFVETKEPCEFGADLCCGSLIKNPGGGICTSGGYVVGKSELVKKAASRLNAPGVGAQIGPTMGINRQIALGLYFAPHSVSEAVKGAVFGSALFSELGYSTAPGPKDERGDIVQSFQMITVEKLIKFCQSIQYASPIDSHVTPIPGQMPGYDCDVIMAAGAFTQGASIEISCDAPIREPYTAYFQGGILFDNVKFAAIAAAAKLGH